MTAIGIEVELAIYQLARPIVCRFLPWTKENPLEKDGTLYHKDASMFEIAMRPCNSGRELDVAYEEAIAQVQSMLPDGAMFDLVPAVEYSDSELESDPYASVLGCGASENIYRGYVNMPDKYQNNIRYAGMHVNISTDKEISELTALSLDAVLGLTSVVNWEQPYKDAIQTRRTVYGRAGEYRMKDFGIEYRTLPANAWGQSSGEQIFDLVDQALDLNAIELCPYAPRIEEAINTCDANAATLLMNELEVQHG